jgi:hypothetical protein
VCLLRMSRTCLQRHLCPPCTILSLGVDIVSLYAMSRATRGAKRARVEVDDDVSEDAEEEVVDVAAWTNPAAGALPRPFDRASLLDPSDRERLDSVNFNYASELISLCHSWSLSLNASLSVAFQHAHNAGVVLDPDQYPGNFVELKYVLEAVRRFSENARAEKRLLAHMTAMVSDMRAPAKRPRPQLVRLYRALGDSMDAAHAEFLAFAHASHYSSWREALFMWLAEVVNTHDAANVLVTSNKVSGFDMMTADTVRAILIKGRETMWNAFAEPRAVFQWLHSTRKLSEKKAKQRKNQRNTNAALADTFLEAANESEGHL